MLYLIIVSIFFFALYFPPKMYKFAERSMCVKAMPRVLLGNPKVRFFVGSLYRQVPHNHLKSRNSNVALCRIRGYFVTVAADW